ncbi:hypothetical protein [Domibacillus epiphyticus]|nr:hypothetical protein [Domibacillus epiphyticus]
MNELVGQCMKCGKKVYCLDGFLNGVKDGGKLLCFDCADEEK